MENIWNEERIRSELARLDIKTGLKGARLPIRFNHAKNTLGSFSVIQGEVFTFSNYYFQNPDWPVEAALDVIRHEYAHYMDYELYGNMAHGKTWKKCCSEVGAISIRCYSSTRTGYFEKKHEKEKEQIRKYDTYGEGEKIVHPHYGIGVIEEITGEGVNRRMIIDFPKTGKKKLGIEWVDQNCKRAGEA